MSKRDAELTKSPFVDKKQDTLSPWWRYSALLVFLVGLIILIYLSTIAFREAPPIPQKVVGPEGRSTFYWQKIFEAGQEVFLKYGLMENGSIWGHGGYIGPDFTAEYLHALAIDANEQMAEEMFGKPLSELSEFQTAAVNAEVRQLLKVNRYDPGKRCAGISLESEKDSYLPADRSLAEIPASGPANTAGLP